MTVVEAHALQAGRQDRRDETRQPGISYRIDEGQHGNDACTLHRIGEACRCLAVACETSGKDLAAFGDELEQIHIQNRWDRRFDRRKTLLKEELDIIRTLGRGVDLQGPDLPWRSTCCSEDRT